MITETPCWLVPPAPSRKRSESCKENKPTGLGHANGRNGRQKLHAAAMRPIPHTRRHKMLPFTGFPEIERFDGDQGRAILPALPAKPAAPVMHRKPSTSAYQAQQIISLNPLPLKKHGCGRAPIQACSEVSRFSFSL